MMLLCSKVTPKSVTGLEVKMPLKEDTPEKRLQALGLDLPEPARPIAEYIPGKMVGNLLFISGQGPMRDGKPVYVGQVGAEVSPEQGYEAARICVLNALAVVKQLTGSLSAIQDIVHVRGFVNSAPGFFSQPYVIDGASELLVAVFGSHGRHARSALGTSSLPGNIPTEVELVVQVSGQLP
jgi:enamine deaminase RidA (YjgF/YER057c/UK114 family)